MSAANLALHVAHSSRLLGRRERIAQLSGVWHDALLLKRHRPTVDQPA